MRSIAKAWAREARREEQLGENPVCYRCGRSELDPVARIRAPLLEDHHVEGCNHNPDFTVLMCRNCHAVMTAIYNDEGVIMKTQPTKIETLIQKLKARSALLRDLANYLLRDADDLRELVPEDNRNNDDQKGE